MSAAAAAGSTALPASAAPNAVAQAARTCSLAGKYQSLGPTYVETLSVSGVGCGTGLRVVKAYYRCRTHPGGPAGRCHHTVIGFRCSEHRTASPVQIYATVHCTRGRAVVNHSYSQNV